MYVNWVVPRQILDSHHLAAALSPLTCVANLANYREDEAVWKIVRKSVVSTTLLSVMCLRITVPGTRRRRPYVLRAHPYVW